MSKEHSMKAGTVLIRLSIAAMFMLVLNVATFGCNGETRPQPDGDDVDMSDGDESDQPAEIEEDVADPDPDPDVQEEDIDPDPVDTDEDIESPDPAIISGVLHTTSEFINKDITFYLFTGYPADDVTPDYTLRKADLPPAAIDFENKTVAYRFTGVAEGSYYVIAHVEVAEDDIIDPWTEIGWALRFPVSVNPADDNAMEATGVDIMFGMDAEGQYSVEGAVTFPNSGYDLPAAALLFPYEVTDPAGPDWNMYTAWPFRVVDIPAPDLPEDGTTTTDRSFAMAGIPAGTSWHAYAWVDLCRNGRDEGDWGAPLSDTALTLPENPGTVTLTTMVLTEPDLVCDTPVDGDVDPEIDAEESGDEDTEPEIDENPGEFATLRGNIYTNPGFAGKSFVLALYTTDPADGSEPLMEEELGVLDTGLSELSWEVSGIPAGTYFLRVYADRLGDGIDASDPFDTLDSGALGALPETGQSTVTIEDIDFYVFGNLFGSVTGLAEHQGRDLYLLLYSDDPEGGQSPVPEIVGLGTFSGAPLPFALEQVAPSSYWLRAAADTDQTGWDTLDPVVDYAFNPVTVAFPARAISRGLNLYFGQVACTDGDRVCDGNAVMQCIEGSYRLLENCDTDTPCTNGSCQVCPTGQQLCINDRILLCQGDRWEVEKDCRNEFPGMICDPMAENPVCVTCPEGESRCSGNTVQHCVSGEWSAQTNCEDSSQVCQFGACIDGEGLDGLWNLAGMVTSGDNACQRPTPGEGVQEIYAFDQTGASLSMTPMRNEMPMIIQDASVDAGNHITGTGTKTEDYNPDFDCVVTFSNTLDAELLPNGVIEGMITMEISTAGEQCDQLVLRGEDFGTTPCNAYWPFQGVRYECTASGIEACDNGIDDDCNGLTDRDDTCAESCAATGERRCGENESLQQCSVDMLWETLEVCDDTGRICDFSDQFQRLECVDRCDSETPAVCDGSWVVACSSESGRIEQTLDCQTLDQVCIDGQCQDLPTTCAQLGERICNPQGTAVLECITNLWVEVENCADGQLICADSQCTPVAYTPYQLQNGDDPGHPAAGTPVMLTNLLITSAPVVVSSASGTMGAFAQAMAGGDYAGIFLVFSGENLPSVTSGDVVDLTGEYTEYPAEGTITLTEVLVDGMTVLWHGQDLPQPVAIDDAGLVATGGSRAAALESQLVEVNDLVNVTGANPGFGEWTVQGGLIVDDLIYSDTAPALNTTMATIRGYLYVSFDDYKVEPRNADDIVAACQETATTCMDGDNGDAVMICNNGRWEVLQYCFGSCVNAACVVCSPDSYSCEGNALYACDATSQWELQDNCQLAGSSCNTQTRQCDACTEGDNRCVGTAKYACNGSGQWLIVEDCAASSRTCNLGQCVDGEQYDGLWMMQGLSQFSGPDSCQQPEPNVPLESIGTITETYNNDQNHYDFTLTFSDAEPLNVSGYIDGDTGVLYGTSNQVVQLGDACTMRFITSMTATPQGDGTLTGNSTLEIEVVDCPSQPADLPGPAPCTFGLSFTLSRYLCQPGMPEMCYNGRDDNCNGIRDEEDCTEPCPEGTYRCNGDVLEQCSPVGLWETRENCAANNATCNPGTFSCDEPCTGTVSECRSDNELWSCVNGFWQETRNCGQENLLCDPVGGYCVMPGDPCLADDLHTCLGTNDVYACTGGVFGFVETCSGGLECVDGACTNPNPCQADFECADLGGTCHSPNGGTCGTACDTHEDCVLWFGSGYAMCDPYNPGHCEPRDVISCTSPFDCLDDNELCHPELGNICAPRCDRNETCQVFNPNTICGTDHLCHIGQGCTRDLQCRQDEGEVCHTGVTAVGECGPACSVNADCNMFGDGFMCDGGYCVEMGISCCGPWKYPETGDVIINEILADPAADLTGDANGDGVRDGSQDEFVELVNISGNILNLSGATLSDAVSVRHTFPEGTYLYCGQAAVLFGGGSPNGNFGNSVVMTASSGLIGLNNGGDDVTVKTRNADTIDAMTYGSDGGNDQSLTLDPQLSPQGSWVLHTTLSGLLFSPGTGPTGTYFTRPDECEGIAACQSTGDCPSPYICHPNADIDGECGTACETESDCSVFGAGLVCNGGLCEQPSAGCSSDTECSAPAVCHPALGDAGVCAVPCAIDADCALLETGLECNPDSHRCEHKVACATSGECYSGEVCHPDVNQGTCGTPCDGNAFCQNIDPDLICDLNNGGVCIWRNMAPCSTDGECSGVGEVCHTDPGGYCWPGCTENLDCQDRFDDELLECVDNHCQTMQYPPCQSDADCQPFGKICHPEIAGGVCAPACTQNTDCAEAGPEYICNTEISRCEVDRTYGCTLNSQCADFNVCQTDIGGFCWAPCRNTADCQQFDIDYVCDDQTGLCSDGVINCTTDNECAAYSKVCHTEISGGICGYPCSSPEDCYLLNDGPGYICDAETSHCIVGTPDGDYDLPEEEEVAGPTPHVVINEVRFGPTPGAQFIELYNTTSATVDIGAYYLTDASKDVETIVNDETVTTSYRYPAIVTGDCAAAGGANDGDFHVRFAPGTTLGAREYLVIAFDLEGFRNAYFGRQPDMLLSDMLDACSGSRSATPVLSAAGENLVLYHWDGASDLVQDVDYFAWGSDEKLRVDKNGLAYDGPDADDIATAYNSETDTGTQAPMPGNPPDNNAYTRKVSGVEGYEPAGGNGIVGHDEMGEDYSTAFVADAATPGFARPPAPMVACDEHSDCSGGQVCQAWNGFFCGIDCNTGYDGLTGTSYCQQYISPSYVCHGDGGCAPPCDGDAQCQMITGVSGSVCSAGVCSTP